MRSSVHVDFGLGLGASAQSGQAASVGLVRARRALLPARFSSPVSATSRERFYRLLRACCAQVEHLRVSFAGAVECDETTFGGVRKGKRGWGAAGEVIAFGLIKRNGLVMAMPIPARDRVSIMQGRKA